MSESNPATAANGETYVAFGAAEVSYILARYPGEATTRSAAMLRVDPGAASPEVLAAGASSLLAHELGTVEDGLLALSGAAELLAYTVSQATHWTEVAFFVEREQVADGALIIQAPLATMILQPRALGTWLAMVKRPEVSPREAVMMLTGAFLVVHPDGVVFLAAETPDGSDALFLRRDNDGRWDIAGEGAASRATAAASPASDPEVLRALDVLMGSTPSSAG